jgi:hypothetical protein
MRFTSRLALAALVAALVIVSFAVAAAVAGAAPGSFVWKRALDPTTKGDGLYLCARGPAASVYACGSLGWEPAAAGDIWLVKYRAVGTQAWSRTWSGPDGLDDDAQAMLADAKGNVYVAGRTKRSLNHWDTVVLKYDAGGHLKWQTIYTADVTGTNEARTIGLDAAGDVYIAGTAVRAGNSDAFTARFRRSDGARRWTCWYDSGGQDTVWAMTVTGAGDCYAAGAATVSGHDSNALLVKSRASGLLAWGKTWNDAQSKDDRWATVNPMPGGGVVVAGAAGDYGSEDAVVRRYSATGQPKWTRFWSSTGTADDRAVDTAVAGDGSVLVAVATVRGTAGYRGALVKWSAAGTRRFARTIGSSAKPVLLYALTLDGSGNAYLSGALAAAGGGYDLLATKYSAAGQLRWRSSAAYAGTNKDGLDDIVLGSSGYLYACGWMAWDAVNGRGVVVKIRR